MIFKKLIAKTVVLAFFSSMLCMLTPVVPSTIAAVHGHDMATTNHHVPVEHHNSAKSDCFGCHIVDNTQLSVGGTGECKSMPPIMYPLFTESQMLASGLFQTNLYIPRDPPGPSQVEKILKSVRLLI